MATDERATTITFRDGPREVSTSSGSRWRRRVVDDGSKWRRVSGRPDDSTPRAETQRVAELFEQADAEWDQDWRHQYGTEPPAGGLDLSELLPLRGRPLGPSHDELIEQRRSEVAVLRGEGLTVEAIAERVYTDRRTVDRDLAVLRSR